MAALQRGRPRGIRCGLPRRRPRRRRLPGHGREHVRRRLGPNRPGGGAAGAIVMDETASTPGARRVVARFYAHESCGQCTPCRETTGWIYRMTERIVEGRGRKEDLDTILDVARRGTGTTICAFYDGAVGPYISYIEKFRAEFEALIPHA